jgi:tetratricopeptide (TPR) repeat protein
MGFEEYVGLLASQSSQADVVSAPAPAKSTKPADPPPSPAPAPVMAPADPRGNEEALERRRQLVALAERYEDLDYYELLGVAHDAPVAQIQAAFFEAAKRFHPDKLGAELADLRPISAKLFARITEARQTLTNPELRSRYEAKLSQGVADGQDEQHRIQQIVNASTCFQKAEVLLKKRMLAAAEEEARRAYENDPEQADYLALLAWIQANKSDSVPLLPEILAQLNVAVRMNPDSEKARFYRAQVLTRLGRNLEAVIDYKFVVAKNPRNIDAQREIRLWEMRQQTPAAASAQQRANSLPAKGGVLSKLFKR